MFSFFFNDPGTTEIYTLALHDALPIFSLMSHRPFDRGPGEGEHQREDRKSTRLNSSHGYTSYAVFCLKKKTRYANQPRRPLHPRRRSRRWSSFARHRRGHRPRRLSSRSRQYRPPMPDALIERLRARGFVPPDYDGGGLINIAATVLDVLGVRDE